MTFQDGFNLAITIVAIVLSILIVLLIGQSMFDEWRNR